MKLKNPFFIKKYPVFSSRIYGEMAAGTACVYYKSLYCEIKPIGPTETIAPGNEVSFTEYWYLFDSTYPNNKQADLNYITNRIKNLKN